MIFHSYVTLPEGILASIIPTHQPIGVLITAQWKQIPTAAAPLPREHGFHSQPRGQRRPQHAEAQHGGVDTQAPRLSRAGRYRGCDNGQLCPRKIYGEWGI